MEQSLKCALSRFRAALEEDGAQPYLERLERARGRRPAEAIHADWPRVGSVLREEPRNKGGWWIHLNPDFVTSGCEFGIAWVTPAKLDSPDHVQPTTCRKSAITRHIKSPDGQGNESRSA